MAIATVIIPCGPRHQHLLARAVRSAYAQTVPVEVAVWLDNDRRGPAYARNRMAERVATPFIVQLDADDLLLPHAVETWLRAWQPGLYVTSDWYQGPQHVRAISCYGLRRSEGEQSFHLPPSLFPTRYWHALGGQDESLFGAEDTEFFYRANAHGIGHRIVREPLFYYTADGYRSREAGQNPEWAALVQGIHARHRKDMSMSCCGGSSAPTTPVGEQQPGDVLARPVGAAIQRTHGAVTQRYYGRINRDYTVWIDPRDVLPGRFTLVTDWAAASPTPAEVEHGLQISDPIEQLAHEIALAGVRVSYEPTVTSGLDIQQSPPELAIFVHWCEAHFRHRPSILEIGTGESGGLARYLLGRDWSVTSIDLNVPTPAPTWTFIQGDSQQMTAHDLPDAMYDVVFIDGDHSAEGVASDYERFAASGRVVAIHDIASAYWPDVGDFWRKLAYTAGGKLRKNFHEAVTVHAERGIGWHVRAD
jgi:hypothetical protein